VEERTVYRRGRSAVAVGVVRQGKKGAGDFVHAWRREGAQRSREGGWNDTEKKN